MDLGPHASFIWSAYAIFAVVLAALVAWLLWDGRRLQRGLDEMDARGVKRRSAGGA
jgi:heme exporter protein D